MMTKVWAADTILAHCARRSASQSSSLMSDWLTIENVRAFGPTVIASLVAAAFAVAQWRVAKAQKDIAYEKLKLELFPKRYAIYVETKALIEYVVSLHDADGINTTFVRDKYIILDEARFFFDADIQSFLKKIHDECELLMLKLGERGNVNADDRQQWNNLAEQLAAQNEKLRDLYASLPQRFENALAFKQVTQFSHHP